MDNVRKSLPLKRKRAKPESNLGPLPLKRKSQSGIEPWSVTIEEKERQSGVEPRSGCSLAFYR